MNDASIVKFENPIKQEEIDKYLDQGNDFIREEEINCYLENKRSPDKKEVRDILAKSLSVKTLLPKETAALINVSDPDLIEEMKKTALDVKKKVYDNRIVTFAPLYLGSFCVNNCVYCGLKSDNHDITRRVLSMDEIKKEVKALAGEIGHKRL